MKRIEIVDERLHRLMGLLLDTLACELINRLCILAERLTRRMERRILIEHRECAAELCDCLLRPWAIHGLGIDADGEIKRCPQRLLECLMGEMSAPEAIEQRFPRLLDERLAERLFHAVRHGKVKGIDALPAEHIVLIRLDGNARQARVCADGVWLAQEPVPRRKAPAKEFQKVDLAAIKCNQRKVLVMDVDEVFAVGHGIAFIEDVVIDKMLCPLGAEFQHDAHGGIRIDVRVVALEI